MSISAISNSSLTSIYATMIQGGQGHQTTDVPTTGDENQMEDILTISLQAQQMSRSGSENPFQADFSRLGSLLESGDLEGAKKAYATLQGHKAGGHHKGGHGGRNIPEDMKKLGDLLNNGDLDGARKLFKEMDEKRQVHEKLATPSPGKIPTMASSIYSMQGTMNLFSSIG